MGPSVSIILDKQRYLRFGFRSSRLLVSALQNAMPQRADKLTIGDVAMLVLRQDQDAVLAAVHRGLNHEDRDTIKFDQVERWLEHAMDEGRDMSEFSLPVLEAMKQANLITLNYKTNVQDAEEESKPDIGAFVDPLTNRGPAGPLAPVGHDQSSRE